MFAANNSRSIYLNGSGKVTNSVSRSVSFNRLCVGTTLVTAGAQEFFSGRLAEIGVWNAALTDDEVVSLARGGSPFLVRPQSLIHYVPLLGAAVDVTGRVALSTSGTTISDHPRIILPS